MANEEQLERFIRKHYAAIYAIALKFVKSPDDAQDIAQNVVVKLWENRDDLNDPQSAEDFLYIYTRNESLNFLRHAKRESERDERYAAESDTQYDLFETIVEEESNQLLRKAIQTLAPQSKRVILLELSGKGMGEIAQLMGVSINTVRTLKYNAIRRLREYFAHLDRLPRPNSSRPSSLQSENH